MYRNGGKAGPNRRRTAVLRVLLASVAFLPITIAPAALAQSSVAATFNFAIPAQPLAVALGEFSRVTGVGIVAGSQLPGNVVSSPVSGEATAEAALVRLLSGTGLSYRFDGIAATILPPAEAGLSYDGSIVLEEINVNAWVENAGTGYRGTPDWVYETPGSISVVGRDAIVSNAGRNTRDLLDGIPGVLANRSEGQNPGLVVNIRGLQDQGRVATMIDGARQNFQRNGHGAYQRPYVDSALIRQVEVEKTSGTGVGGMGSLGGSVDFRTLIADDLLDPDHRIGGEISLGTGSNAYNFTGSVAGAVRIGDNVTVLGALSGINIGAYAIGQNGAVTLNEMTNQGGAAIFTGSESGSSLLKTEAQITSDLSFDAGWLRNVSNSSQGGIKPLTGGQKIDQQLQKVTTDTLTANLAWDPESGLVDLKAKVWLNNLQNDETRIYSDTTTPYDVDYALMSFGGSLENTSTFETDLGALALHYGVEAFRDVGDSKVNTSLGTIDGADMNIGLTGPNPGGKRDMASAFLNATLDHDTWLTVSGGARYDLTRISGSTTIYGYSRTVPQPPMQQWVDETESDYGPLIAAVGRPIGEMLIAADLAGNPAKYRRPGTDIVVTPGRYISVPQPSKSVMDSVALDVDRTFSALLPHASVAVRPIDGVELFASFAQTSRAPSVMESLFSGAHPFTPPNNYAPNPNLNPERANTYEIGANLTFDEILLDGDSLRLKAVAFRRDIEDYIGMGTIYNSTLDKRHLTFVNLNGTSTMTGVEVEAAYDARHFYIGGAFTWLDTDLADTYIYRGPTLGTVYVDGREQKVEGSIQFVQPKYRASLDAGVRLMEEALTIGARVNHVSGTDPTAGVLATNYVIKDYTTVDLYSAYELSDNVTFRAGVSNLFDTAYAPALGANTLPAPGRTFTLGVNAKF